MLGAILGAGAEINQIQLHLRTRSSKAIDDDDTPNQPFFPADISTHDSTSLVFCSCTCLHLALKTPFTLAAGIRSDGLASSSLGFNRVPWTNPFKENEEGERAHLGFPTERCDSSSSEHTQGPGQGWSAACKSGQAQTPKRPTCTAILLERPGLKKLAPQLSHCRHRRIPSPTNPPRRRPPSSSPLLSPASNTTDRHNTDVLVHSKLLTKKYEEARRSKAQGNHRTRFHSLSWSHSPSSTLQRPTFRPSLALCFCGSKIRRRAPIPGSNSVPRETLVAAVDHLYPLPPPLVTVIANVLCDPGSDLYLAHGIATTGHLVARIEWPYSGAVSCAKSI